MSHQSSSNNQMMVSNSDFNSTKPDLTGLKSHRIIASVLEGKTPSDYETAWSPTSPLDFRVFSSFGSIRKMHQKSWDSGKVGLSILDSLVDHHHNSSRILLPSVDSKNIIFGSLMRNHLLSQPFAKTVTQKDEKSPNVDVVELGVKKQSSGSLDGDDDDIEVSEDYTCVISHGLNPKTTRFYGDRVLEKVESNAVEKGCCVEKKESLFVIAPLDFDTGDDDLIRLSDFLSSCWSCSKKLGMGKHIYMYRGYKAFCSSECRWKEMEEDDKIEEDKEDEEEAAAKCGSSKKKSNGVISTVA